MSTNQYSFSESKVHIYSLSICTLTVSCNDNPTVMVKMSSSLTSEDRNPVVYGMKSSDLTNNLTFISFSFWRSVEADMKKFCVVFIYSIKDSIDQQNHREKI